MKWSQTVTTSGTSNICSRRSAHSWRSEATAAWNWIRIEEREMTGGIAVPRVSRCPEDLILQLGVGRAIFLRSQTVTLKRGHGPHRRFLPYPFMASDVTALRPQSATSNVGRGGRVLDLRPREGYLSCICSPLDQPSGLRRGFVFRGQARRTEIADLKSQSVTSNLKRLAALGSQFEESCALAERIGQNLSEPAFVQAGREGS
jgi:hypothetical protein